MAAKNLTKNPRRFPRSTKLSFSTAASLGAGGPKISVGMVRSRHALALKYASEELKSDRDFMMRVVSQSWVLSSSIPYQGTAYHSSKRQSASQNGAFPGLLSVNSPALILSKNSSVFLVKVG